MKARIEEDTLAPNGPKRIYRIVYVTLEDGTLEAFAWKGRPEEEWRLKEIVAKLNS